MNNILSGYFASGFLGGKIQLFFRDDANFGSEYLVHFIYIIMIPQRSFQLQPKN
jgi:hypothetical protein